jgi:N-acetyl-anhydromuramyl-L-alanine amidase AmpD
MEEPSRRSFLLAVLGLALSGCTGRVTRLISDEEFLIALERKYPDPEPEPSPKSGLPTDLKVMPRSAWAPYPPIRKRLVPMKRIRKITVHHEGSRVNTSMSRWNVAADLKDIRRVHLRVMHAGDIGYHYIIDRAGRIWEGRPRCYQGAHCGGSANIENLGIMLLGNFDLQRPSAQQIATLDRFLRHEMNRYSVPMKRVFTHRELKPTRCPGRHLQFHMNRFRHKA